MNMFFIVVTFVMSTPDVDRPIYIFSKPSFDNYIKCYEHVQKNNMNMFRSAAGAYNFKLQPEAIYCLNEKAVKEIFDYNGNPAEKKNI